MGMERTVFELELVDDFRTVAVLGNEGAGNAARVP